MVCLLSGRENERARTAIHRPAHADAGRQGPVGAVHVPAVGGVPFDEKAAGETGGASDEDPRCHGVSHEFCDPTIIFQARHTRGLGCFSVGPKNSRS